MSWSPTCLPGDTFLPLCLDPSRINFLPRPHEPPPTIEPYLQGVHCGGLRLWFKSADIWVDHCLLGAVLGTVVGKAASLHSPTGCQEQPQCDNHRCYPDITQCQRGCGRKKWIWGPHPLVSEELGLCPGSGQELVGGPEPLLSLVLAGACESMTLWTGGRRVNRWLWGHLQLSSRSLSLLRLLPCHKFCKAMAAS